MKGLVAISLGLLLALAAPVPRAGAAANKTVEAANAQYRDGNYQEALDTYARLAEKSPENAELQFNQGAALYKLGDVNQARQSFEKASLLSDDPRLQALSAYNMGNCAFESAREKMGEKPEDAIADLNRSVQHYKDALARNKELADAAHNLETAKRTIQQLRRQMEQREQEQQHQQDEMKKKLDELIEEQEKQNSQSQEAAEKQQDPAQTPPEKQEMDQMAQEQQATREKTEELSQEMDSKAQEEGQEAMEEAKQRAEAAAGKQQEAEQHLENQDASQGNKAQEEALEELKKARDALGEGGEPEEKQAENEPEESDSEGEQQDGPPPAGEMNEGPPPDATARDILEQEKRTKEQRAIVEMKRLQPVEKDW